MRIPFIRGNASQEINKEMIWNPGHQVVHAEAYKNIQYESQSVKGNEVKQNGWPRCRTASAARRFSSSAARRVSSSAARSFFSSAARWASAVGFKGRVGVSTWAVAAPSERLSGGRATGVVGAPHCPTADWRASGTVARRVAALLGRLVCCGFPFDGAAADDGVALALLGRPSR